MITTYADNARRFACNFSNKFHTGLLNLNVISASGTSEL
jgi:hypothetical protein